MEQNDYMDDPELDEILSDHMLDFSAAFTNDQLFPTRKEMIDWAQSVAIANGFVIVILRSDSGTLGRKAKVLLGCERGGKYKLYKNMLKQPTTGTKKCECPFRLKGRLGVKLKGWKLNVINGFHNHKTYDSLIGHPFAGRLKAEERLLVSEMSSAGVKPRPIMIALKEKFKGNLSSMTTIYNERQKIRKEERGPRTEFQHLLRELERLNYAWWYRSDPTNDIDDDVVVSDLFMAHEKSVQLVNTFHIVLLIDSTYKTNRYKMPLLEIVGVTSTNLTFNVGFALLDKEKTENFIWALERVKDCLLLSKGEASKGEPSVIVTDRDLALLKAVKHVFPRAKHLLCTYHINVNVNAKCRALVNPPEVRKDVMDIWQRIIHSTTEDDYHLNVTQLENFGHTTSGFVKYVQETWLMPHHDMFVSAWTDKFMHLDNSTSNRVEGAHAKLKSLLKDSCCDLCACFDGIHKLLTLQHIELTKSFQQSLILVEHRFNNVFYKSVKGVLSRYALGLIHSELARSTKIGIDLSECGCILRRTHGLPCACKLAHHFLFDKVLPLRGIHSHWARLTFQVPQHDGQPQKASLEAELEMINANFQGLNFSNQMIYKARIREFACPETSSSVPPPVKVKKGDSSKKDRSNKRDPSFFEHVDSFFDRASPGVASATAKTNNKTTMPYVNQFPEQLHPYIQRINDVRADGNCGYRVIAVAAGFGEDGWPNVRHGLIAELSSKPGLYLSIFGSQQKISQVQNAIWVGTNDPNQGVCHDKWLNLPEVGYIVANRFRMVVISLASSPLGCYTIFPFDGGIPHQNVPIKYCCIGHVNNNHFVHVILKEGCPIPLSDIIWRRRREASASIWEQAFQDRQLQFRKLFAEDPTDPVDLGDD